jgi:hypothetical protein
MSATISSGDEYKAAAERAKELGHSGEGTPEAAEATDLAAAMRKVGGGTEGARRGRS